ncbi:MAG TPA: sodium ion-translocating decarboxylase subunit beta [Dehalococcoidia bacterium]|nr:sodium ion-translocating decarboxylase subunit beta [Dehalococcoidia bacterium]
MFGIEMGFAFLTWRHLIMLVVGGVLIYLGIAKKWEPLLLVPIGFGIVLVNIPLGYGVMGFQMPDGTVMDYLPPIWPELIEQGGRPIGFLSHIFQYGFGWGLIPLFMFIGIGAMTDFGPLIARPIYFLLGAAAQFGVYAAFFMALGLGFNIPEACSIGIIGGADGPTTVYLTTKLAPGLLGATAIAAYTYMAMVPLIQPPIIRAMTTKEERKIYMAPTLREVSKTEQVIFPIMVTVVVGLLLPEALPIIGCFMLGNLLRVSGVTDRLGVTMSGAFIDIATVFLGVCVGAYVAATSFLLPQPLMVFGLGVIAFAFATMGGVLFAKLMNLFLKSKINPMIGAAGVSAVPMAARVVQRLGQQANPRNFLLMHAMGPNAAGVIGTVAAAGVFLSLVG